MPLSPDVPAYINYLVVIASGVFVAFTRVNSILDDQPDRWAFFRTWLLALAHVVIPPLLFWFLDYTEAIHDTNFFVALVVGFGYRQVFQGGVSGIAVSGQAPSLWKPFEAWVERAVQGITVKSKTYRDRFDDTSKPLIAHDPTMLAKLEELATVYSNNPPVLAANANAARAFYTGTHLSTILIGIFWDDLRTSKPVRYAHLLRDDGLVPGWKVWWWFDKGRSKTVITSVLVALMVLFILVGPVGMRNWNRFLLTYNQQRVLKLHATERDRHRSIGYLDAELARLDRQFDDAEKAAVSRPATTGAPQLATTPTVPEKSSSSPKTAEAKAALESSLREMLGRLLSELKYSELPEPTADRVLNVVLRSRSAIRDDTIARTLIAALWTENGAVRARINRSLVLVQEAAFADHPLPDGLAKAPESGEPFEAIDRRARAWLKWWEGRLKSLTPAPSDQPPIVAGVTRGRFIVEVPFAFNRAELPPDLERPLEDLGTLLKGNPAWHLRVEGHTDNVGRDAANLDLSRRRATTIMNFLKDKQRVSADQLTVRAVGEAEPRASNDTEDGRRQNRRVELLRTDGEFAK